MKRKLLLGMLTLSGLAVMAACAGSSAAAPVEPDPGSRAVPVADTFEGFDAPPTSSDAAPAEQAPSMQQAPAPEPSGGGVQELTTTSNQQSETSLNGSGGGSQTTEYTWQDGDRAQTVILQSDLVIDGEASEKGALGNAPGGAIVKSEDAQGQGNGQPVFKSQSGALMTLPGGILLVLDPDWTQAEVDAFFSSNSIKQDAVDELDYIDNGYFIETEPGFPSLDLANSLAVQDGVVLSSPNWWTEVSVK